MAQQCLANIVSLIKRYLKTKFQVTATINNIALQLDDRVVIYWPQFNLHNLQGGNIYDYGHYSSLTKAKWLVVSLHPFLHDYCNLLYVNPHRTIRWLRVNAPEPLIKSYTIDVVAKKSSCAQHHGGAEY